MKGIKAFYEKDQKTYDGLLSEVRSARFKRKKPKTAVTSRSRRQSKGKRSLTDNSDDIDVLRSGNMKVRIWFVLEQASSLDFFQAERTDNFQGSSSIVKLFLK